MGFKMMDLSFFKTKKVLVLLSLDTVWSRPGNLICFL